MKERRRRASIHDLIYSFKDYKKEANLMKSIIAKHKKSKGKDLLECPCGTGKHITELKKHFNCHGTDLNTNALKIAKIRNPDVKFYESGIDDLDVVGEYDVIACLFNAIGHMGSVKELQKAMKRFYDHLKPGGIALIEPWLTPSQIKPGMITLQTHETDNTKVTRMTYTKKKGKESILEFNYLWGKKEKGIEHFQDKLRLTLFTKEEYEKAMRKAGFTVKKTPKNVLSGRGLYICTKKL